LIDEFAVADVDVILLRIFGEQPFNIAISPQPFTNDLQAGDTDTVITDSTAVVYCDNKPSAVKALFAAYLTSSVLQLRGTLLKGSKEQIFRISMPKPGQAVDCLLN
jgi:hypothetical protein